jgi:hypothetical protein
MSIRMPMTTGRLMAFWVMVRAIIALPIDSGNENRIVIGYRKLANNKPSTAQTIIRPAPIALPKFSNISSMT